MSDIERANKILAIQATRREFIAMSAESVTFRNNLTAITNIMARPVVEQAIAQAVQQSLDVQNIEGKPKEPDLEAQERESFSVKARELASYAEVLVKTKDDHWPDPNSSLAFGRIQISLGSFPQAALDAIARYPSRDTQTPHKAAALIYADLGEFDKAEKVLFPGDPRYSNPSVYNDAQFWIQYGQLLKKNNIDPKSILDKFGAVIKKSKSWNYSNPNDELMKGSFEFGLTGRVHDWFRKQLEKTNYVRIDKANHFAYFEDFDRAWELVESRLDKPDKYERKVLFENDLKVLEKIIKGQLEKGQVREAARNAKKAFEVATRQTMDNCGTYFAQAPIIFKILEGQAYGKANVMAARSLFEEALGMTKKAEFHYPQEVIKSTLFSKIGEAQKAAGLDHSQTFHLAQQEFELNKIRDNRGFGDLDSLVRSRFTESATIQLYCGDPTFAQNIIDHLKEKREAIFEMYGNYHCWRHTNALTIQLVCALADFYRQKALGKEFVPINPIVEWR